MAASQAKRVIGTPNRPMPKGRAIDPVRVLRRHWKGIPVFAVIGAILGLVAYILFARFYPLYSGEVLFEVRPGVSEATDIGTVDISNDRTVERVAATQIFLLKTREILTQAVSDRTVRKTVWMEYYKDPETEVYLIDSAVDDLIEELSTPIIPGTNLYGVRWRAHVAADVPIMLTAISVAYLKYVEDLDADIFRKNEMLFDEEGARIKLTLQDLNDELQSFIRMKGITTLDDTRFSQDMYEIQQLTQTLNTTRVQLSSMQQKYL